MLCHNVRALPAHLLRQQNIDMHATSMPVRMAQQGLASEDRFCAYMAILLYSLSEPLAHLIEGNWRSCKVGQVDVLPETNLAPNSVKSSQRM